ncbi:hypothetical protein HZA56_06050 [Candidatus Poribacteria bacterium]|nr:hypothetical protein [Candidatus Poribacteria bacterium]
MNVGKRILILGAFGVVFAIFIVAGQSLVSSNHSAAPVPEPKPAAAKPERPPSPNPSPLPSPTDVGQTSPSKQKATSAGPAAQTSEKQRAPSLREMFLSGQPAEGVAVDAAEVERLLRDHVTRNHPNLKLSDADYERLAKSLKTFRDANMKMRSTERTSANSAVFQQALEDVAESSTEFRKITGMAPGEFFMRGASPVQFGNDRQAQGNNDEVVTEYLSDHKP